MRRPQGEFVLRVDFRAERLFKKANAFLRRPRGVLVRRADFRGAAGRSAFSKKQTRFCGAHGECSWAADLGAAKLGGPTQWGACSLGRSAFSKKQTRFCGAHGECSCGTQI